MAIKALAWMVRIAEPPVYCYHDIVHNRVVVEQFRRAGVVFVDDIDEVPPGAPLMLSAHGSAPEIVTTARARHRVVVDAVCPLVKKVHHEVRRRSEAGHTIVYAGHATHDEAIGTLAVAPSSTHLVEQPADVTTLDEATGPVAFLAQTTLAASDWQAILDATRDRFGEVWVPGRSDLCFATTNRQAAVRAIAPRCDAVVVIGSDSSSNARALAQVARASGPVRVVQVNGPDDLPGDLSGVVGVTAGASAPEEVVERVVEHLAPTGGVEVVDVTTEDEYFPPPGELRELARAVGAEDLLDDDRSVAASDVLRQLAQGVPAARAAARHEQAVASLRAHSSQVDEQMRAVVDEDVADLQLRQAIGYHLGWLDEGFEPLAPGATRSGGKKLRAALAVLCSRAAAVAAASDAADHGAVERVIPLAAALELMHNWSLVHDDIQDGDRTRRGRPALWTVCGVGPAVNVGDCLHGLAFQAVHRLRDHGVGDGTRAELLADLARTTVELTVGQMRDLAFETTLAVDSQRYLEMIEGKTGALMRSATFGGAYVGSGDRSVAQAFGDFGRQLGLSFQIRDDILGIWGTDAETGKPTGGDIRRRKKTLPLVLALERAEARDHEHLVRLYTQDGPLTPADEQAVRRILDDCDVQARAQEEARHHRAAAVMALSRAAGAHERLLAPPFAALRALADFVTERAH